MEIDIESLKDRYKTMQDDELLKLAGGGDLTIEAKEVLKDEMMNRVLAYPDANSVDLVDIPREKDQWAKNIGLALMLFIVLWTYFISADTRSISALK